YAGKIDVVESPRVVRFELVGSENVICRRFKHGDRVLEELCPALCRVFEIGDVAHKLLGDFMYSCERGVAQDGARLVASRIELLRIGEDIGNHVAGGSAMRRGGCGDRSEDVESLRLVLVEYKRRPLIGAVVILK